MRRASGIIYCLASALSLLLFLSLGFLLVRSYWRADEACYLAPGRGRYFETCRGVFSFYSGKTYAYPRSGNWSYSGHDEPLAQQRIMDTITARVGETGAHFDLAGFSYAGSAVHENVAVVIRFPLWLPVLLLGVLVVLLLRYRRRSDGEGTRRCGKCGYDLRVTPDRCPECGTIPLQNAS